MFSTPFTLSKAAGTALMSNKQARRESSHTKMIDSITKIKIMFTYCTKNFKKNLTLRSIFFLYEVLRSIQIHSIQIHFPLNIARSSAVRHTAARRHRSTANSFRIRLRSPTATCTNNSGSPPGFLQ